MAGLFKAASSQYLSAAAAAVTADGCTFACWYRPASTAQSALAVIGNATTGARLQLWAGSTAVSATRINDALTSAQSDSLGTNTAGTSIHCAAVFNTSGGNIIAYRNGVAGTPATNPGGVITLNRTLVGTRYNGSAFGLFADGDIAEVGIWNAILTPTEIAGLAKGFSPSTVKAANLVFELRLIRTIQDLRRGLSLTNVGGVAVSNHPRIFR